MPVRTFNPIFRIIWGCLSAEMWDTRGNRGSTGRFPKWYGDKIRTSPRCLLPVFPLRGDRLSRGVPLILGRATYRENDPALVRRFRFSLDDLHGFLPKLFVTGLSIRPRLGEIFFSATPSLSAHRITYTLLFDTSCRA